MIPFMNIFSFSILFIAVFKELNAQNVTQLFDSIANKLINNTVAETNKFNMLKQTIYNTSWINNTNLTLYHLQKLSTLVNYQKVPLSNYDIDILFTTYYDDSSDTANLIQSFFNSFNHQIH